MEVNIGVGKNEEYDRVTADTTKERRKLDIEIEQTQEVKRQRTENAIREEVLDSNIKSMNKEFFCDICDKQYKNITEVFDIL